MSIFDIKNVKRLFIFIGVILFSYIILGQIMISMAANDFKKELINHDYEVAGFLYESNIGISNMPSAFIHDKSEEDRAQGEALLKEAGYDESTNYNLIPSVKYFHSKYTVINFILSLGISITLLVIVLVFTSNCNKTLEKANLDILSFMKGRYEIRLDDNKEGNFSKLFSSVNVMATSLTTHIIKERKNRDFLKDIIANISHQLKTPLAALEMYNEIILDENIENEVVKTFNLKIKSELERMENLIQNLLKLARLDAGAVELIKENCNLKYFLEDITMRFQTRAECEGKSIILNCDDNINFLCDKLWMQESLCNIVKNALDHTEAGDKVLISCDDTPLGTKITIKDNGFGIHSEDLHYIFKRFYRSRFSKDTKGVGIGLTLAKSIIEKHNGTIMVESKLGKGTIFNLFFSKLTTL